jgi:hypothetical protein
VKVISLRPSVSPVYLSYLARFDRPFLFAAHTHVTMPESDVDLETMNQQVDGKRAPTPNLERSPASTRLDRHQRA